MKKFFVFFGILSMIISMVGCGSSTEGASSNAGTSVTIDSEASMGSSSSVAADQVDMLYYLKLDENSIMAACYTAEGIERLGEDYYVVHVGNAEIYNTLGEKICLEELPRGCPIRITWPGIVMQSYPGQINAETVTMLSDTPDPAVPPEDEIEPFNNGAKWWISQPVTEVPTLGIEYRNDTAAVTVLLEKQYGSWSYLAEDGESALSGGASNAQKDGRNPWEWGYDDRNTIVQDGFNTLTLTLSPEAQELQVTAYVYDDMQDKGTIVDLSNNNTLTLLGGDYIYVVNAVWNSNEYQGEATYSFLVKDS